MGAEAERVICEVNFGTGTFREVGPALADRAEEMRAAVLGLIRRAQGRFRAEGASGPHVEGLMDALDFLRESVATISLPAPPAIDRAREEGRLEGFADAEELIASWLERRAETLEVLSTRGRPTMDKSAHESLLLQFRTDMEGHAIAMRAAGDRAGLSLLAATEACAEVGEFEAASVLMALCALREAGDRPGLFELATMAAAPLSRCASEEEVQDGH